MKGLFTYAVKREYIERSPLDRLDCPPDMEPRERVLTDAELRTVIERARMSGYPYGTVVELCAVLGQRRHQIGALRPQYVDFEKMAITWPPELMNGSATRDPVRPDDRGDSLRHHAQRRRAVLCFAGKQPVCRQIGQYRPFH